MPVPPPPAPPLGSRSVLSTPSVGHNGVVAHSKPRVKTSSWVLLTALVCVLVVGLEVTFFSARDAYIQAYDVPTPTADGGTFGQDAVDVAEGTDQTTKQGYEAEVEVLKASVEEFWSGAYPTHFGEKLNKLDGGVVSWDGGRLPAEARACGLESAMIVNNAAYLPCADMILYDNTELFPSIESEYGPLALGVVIAHEWGHAVQQRSGDDDLSSILSENQADCYAGAWLTHFRNSSAWGEGGEEALPWALAVTATISDPAGESSPEDEDAHGSMFDRVGAVMDGMNGGVGVCAAYPDNPPRSVMLQWDMTTDTGVQDYRTGGELSEDSFAEMTEMSVEEYWRLRVAGGAVPDISGVLQAGDGCEMPEGSYLYAWCGKKSTLISGETSWVPPVAPKGDMVRILTLTLPYIDGVKDLNGVGAHRACLAGEWFAFELNGKDPVFSLSPPDVDEAAWAMVLADWAQAGDGGRFTGEHITEFRRGVLTGCGTSLPQPILTAPPVTGS